MPHHKLELGGWFTLPLTLKFPDNFFFNLNCDNLFIYLALGNYFSSKGIKPTGTLSPKRMGKYHI